MNRAFGSMTRFNLTATVCCLLLNTSSVHCSKEDDKTVKDFTSFLKQFGDKSLGDIFENAAGTVSGSKTAKDVDPSYLFDSASAKVRQFFETGKPQEVSGVGSLYPSMKVAETLF